MADAFVTVELEGDEAAGGDLQLNQFIEELRAVQNALRHSERTELRREEQAVRYRVTNLTHSSPAKVTITVSSREPAYKNVPRKIVRRFASSLSVVKRNHRYAERLDLKTLETFKAIAAPAIKHNIKVKVSVDTKPSISLDRAFEVSVSRLIAGDERERERDELVGRIERVDIHNKNSFDIYPLIGPERVRCSASKKLQSQIVAAMGLYVSVEGVALYRKDARFPYAMRVDAIHARRPDSELPTMQQLHGIAPEATGGLKSEDFVRELRNANW